MRLTRYGCANTSRPTNGTAVPTATSKCQCGIPARNTSSKAMAVKKTAVPKSGSSNTSDGDSHGHENEVTYEKLLICETRSRRDAGAIHHQQPDTGQCSCSENQ